MSRLHVLKNLSYQHTTRSFALIGYATLSTLVCMLLLDRILPAPMMSQVMVVTVLVIILIIANVYLFNFILWRWNILHRLNLIDYPDLNGVWTGYLTSEWTEHGKLYPISLEIRQTWLWTDIDFQTEDSRSKSHSVSMMRDSDHNHQVHYIYHAVPSADVHPDWKPFYGLCVMTYREGHILSGYYEYFDRKNQRAIHGQMYAERGTQAIMSLKDDPRQLG